jgi:hypothetical protein
MNRELSRYSDSDGLDCRGLIYARGKRFFFSPQSLAMGPIQPSLQWIPEFPFSRVKWPRRGADNSPLSNADVKNDYLAISLNLLSKIILLSPIIATTRKSCINCRRPLSVRRIFRVLREHICNVSRFADLEMGVQFNTRSKRFCCPLGRRLDSP